MAQERGIAMRGASGHARRSARARVERGASAVEFALISVVFFPMLFGLMDYGMWFNDSLNARQGVREAARHAVVGNFSGSPDCGSGIDAVKCVAKDEVSSMTGKTSVKVIAPNGWVKGEPLVVCAAVKVNGITGLVPLPNNRVITASTQMSIEVESSAATASTPEADPSGRNWSWCS